ATARDASGNTSAAEATLTIGSLPDIEGPQVTLNAPLQAAPGATIRFSATASDNTGVARLVFLVNGAAVGPGATTPPSEAAFVVPPGTPAGSSLGVTARAFDYANNPGEANATVAIVAASDTTPPTVVLTAPAMAAAGSTVHVSAEAHDVAGLAS